MLQKDKVLPHNIPSFDEGEGASIESEDSYKYEIDTKVLLEETYNNWLGRSKKGGKWVDDPFKKAMMSKELADKMIQSIRLKVNTHSLISRYDDDRFIKKVAWMTARTWNRALRFKLTDYKLSVEDYSLLVTNDIPFLIEQLLYAAKGGFMMTARTEKGKINVVQQKSDEMGGL